MPQPYPKHLTPNCSVGNTVETHPGFCLMGMHIITQYSQLEVMFSVILTALLGSQPKPAIAILTVIKNSNIRTEAMRAVAEETLPGDRLELFNGVLKVVETADKERNRIAHWLWASDPQLDNAVVLIDPRKFASLNSDTAIMMANGSVEHAQAIALQDKMRDMALVYRESDFVFADKAVNRAIVLLNALSTFLRHADGTSEATNARELILNGPDVGIKIVGAGTPVTATSSQSVHS